MGALTQYEIENIYNDANLSMYGSPNIFFTLKKEINGIEHFMSRFKHKESSLVSFSTQLVYYV